MKKGFSLVVAILVIGIVVLGIVEIVDIKAAIFEVQHNIQEKWTEDEVDHAGVIVGKELEELQDIINGYKRDLRDREVELALEKRVLDELERQYDEKEVLKIGFASRVRTALEESTDTFSFYGIDYTIDQAERQLTSYVLESNELAEKCESQQHKIAGKEQAVLGLEQSIREAIGEYRDLENRSMELIAQKEISEINAISNEVRGIIDGTVHESELSEATRKINMILDGLEKRIIATDVSMHTSVSKDFDGVEDNNLRTYEETLRARDVFEREEEVRDEVEALLAGESKIE
jgi:hypothetical protein